MAQKIAETLSEPFMLQGHAIKISVSVGVALYPDHGGEGQELLRNADSAMYQAKALGKNTIHIRQ